jgi:hypothetical protein
MVEAVHRQAHRARRAVGHDEADAEAVGLGIEVERHRVLGHVVRPSHHVTVLPMHLPIAIFKWI